VELLLVLGLVLLPLALGLVLLPLLRTCFVTGSQHLTVPDELAPGAVVVLGVWAAAIPMVAVSIVAASRLTVIRMRVIPSSHVWMAPAPQEILLGVEQLSLAVMCPARWCSPDGLLALMGSANRGLITRAGSMSR